MFENTVGVTGLIVAICMFVVDDIAPEDPVADNVDASASTIDDPNNCFGGSLLGVMRLHFIPFPCFNIDQYFLSSLTTLITVNVSSFCNISGLGSKRYSFTYKCINKNQTMTVVVYLSGNVTL